MHDNNLTPIAITGMGVVTPLGNTLEGLWNALLENISAAREWSDLADEGFRITSACRVAEFESTKTSRGKEMAIAAIHAALNDASAPLDNRLGIFVGTTMGESALFEQAAETGHTVDLTAASASVYPRAILSALGIRGISRAYGNACAAGNYSIGVAADMLRRRRIDVAIAGGVDAFSRIAMLGFSRSRAMTPDICAPFDADRRGMQLGEAAAFLVLERLDDARSRGARIYAGVNSLGLASDAYHATAPRPDGSGMATAMRMALARGRVAAEDVGFICAHGSGTRASDAAEAAAITGSFDHRPVVASYKGALGHSLGAATAVEAAITALALCKRIVPPTTNTVKVDPTMDIDLALASRPLPELRYALNCGYAFGGLNSALLMEAL